MNILNLTGGGDLAKKKVNKKYINIVYLVILLVVYMLMRNYDGNLGQTSLATGIIKEDEYNIYIDLTKSMLYLFKGDELVAKYPVAQGKSSSPSPIGSWKIVYKARNWGSGFGTRWMGLNVPWGKYGIHGTNKPGSIGSMASGGCFRMHNRDVEKLYDIVPTGTKVVVYGGPFGNIGSGLRKLTPGDRSSHVLEVQKRLKNLGYYEGSLDGIYGEGLKNAIIRFKKDMGLPINHTVDWQTYNALGIISFE
jgi:hypothetical protein